MYSAFVSYTQIFDPQNNRRRDGSYLEPVLGTGREAGIKGRHFDGALNTSLVVFETKQDHVADALPALRPSLPRSLVRLFSTYTLPDAWHRVTVGGGVNWQGPSKAQVDGPFGPQQLAQSSMTLVSAMARDFSNLYDAPGASWNVTFTYRFF
nr:hypothetical protein [Luteibacter sp. 9135]